MTETQSMRISIVIPVYNEEVLVEKVHKEVVKVLDQLQKPYEIIFVDDGSIDNTERELRKLHPVTVIRFRRNFGQTAALDAGIKEARGEYIVTMDGDGQNDPHDIPNLLKEIESKNLDVVSGWRKCRQDPPMKKLASRTAAVMRRMLINDGIHDSGCTLKIFRRECFDHTDLSGEMHRFIPGLLKIKGFSVGEIVVNHRRRVLGETKYNTWRGVHGILDMFAVWFWRKYADRPLYLFGGVGIFLLAVSVLAGGWALYEKIFHGLDLSDTALTIFAMFGFLIGIQFFVFGILVDIILKNYFATKGESVYEVKGIYKSDDHAV